MAYASIADINKILSTDESPLPSPPGSGAEEQRIVVNVQTVLEEATDLLVSVLHREYAGDEGDDGVPDDVPGPVRRVCARMALRAFTEDDADAGAEATTSLMGPFSRTINWRAEAQDRSVYLSDTERERLEPFILNYQGGAAHYPMFDCESPFYYSSAGGYAGY